VTAFVGPRSKDTAKALLALADEQGLHPSVVRATDGGYHVPESIADAFTAPAEKAAPKEAPKAAKEAPKAAAEAPKPARRKRPAQDKESAG